MRLGEIYHKVEPSIVPAVAIGLFDEMERGIKDELKEYLLSMNEFPNRVKRDMLKIIGERDVMREPFSPGLSLAESARKTFNIEMTETDRKKLSEIGMLNYFFLISADDFLDGRIDSSEAADMHYALLGQRVHDLVGGFSDSREIMRRHDTLIDDWKMIETKGGFCDPSQAHLKASPLKLSALLCAVISGQEQDFARYGDYFDRLAGLNAKVDDLLDGEEDLSRGVQNSFTSHISISRGGTDQLFAIEHLMPYLQGLSDSAASLSSLQFCTYGDLHKFACGIKKGLENVLSKIDSLPGDERRQLIAHSFEST